MIAEDKEVIAVFHSFAAIPGTEALHGLGKATGKGAGGVIAIFYIASMVPKAGKSFETHVESLGDTTWMPAKQALFQVIISKRWSKLILIEMS